jgi:hypothetical protein
MRRARQGIRGCAGDSLAIDGLRWDDVRLTRARGIGDGRRVLTCGRDVGGTVHT